MFFSGKAIIARQDEEIKYLRELVRDLNNRIMSRDASDYLALKSNDEEFQDISIYDDIKGKIVSMAAETDEEKEAQEAALDEIRELMKH